MIETWMVMWNISLPRVTYRVSLCVVSKKHDKTCQTNYSHFMLLFEKCLSALWPNMKIFGCCYWFITLTHLNYFIAISG